MASPLDAITHIVLFQVKEDLSAVQRRSVWEGMYSLKTKCIGATSGKPYIKSIVGGKDNSLEGRQDGITHVFIVEFESSADRDYYATKDPAHQAFMAENQEHLVKAQVVDFTPYRF